jgi:hypothetical protein
MPVLEADATVMRLDSLAAHRLTISAVSWDCSLATIGLIATI